MRLFRISLAAALFVLAPTALSAQRLPAADSTALDRQGDALIAAYGKGDAKALANLFTTGAVLVNGDGTVVIGRAAIEKQFADMFNGPSRGMQIAARPSSPARLIAPNVAIGQGTFEVLMGDQVVQRSLWSSVDVNGPDGWKIAQMTSAVLTMPAASPNE